ncbi:MAG: hypothetical protein MJE12_06375 [Alphaproteobacteria bacterium]|nr:hypothetical protein [Alphaproteobacteria bacterium]
MTAEQTAPRRRSIWIWLIAIFYVLSGVWTALSYYLILSGTLRVDSAQQAYLQSFTAFDYVATVGLGLLNLAAAVVLFLLRRTALYLFLVSLGLELLLLVWHAAAKGWVEAVGGSGMLGYFIGLALQIVVCLYVWRQVQNGTLR